MQVYVIKMQHLLLIMITQLKACFKMVYSLNVFGKIYFKYACYRLILKKLNFCFDSKFSFAGNGREYCDRCGQQIVVNDETANILKTNNISNILTKSEKIIGGVVTNLLNWPYVVYITHEKNDTHPICGGVLINHRTIITAAHCLLLHNGTYRRIKIFLTINITFKSFFQIDEIIVHPFYQQITHQNDICIIKLKNFVNLKFACLPPFDKMYPESHMINEAYVIGYGATETQTYSNELREAKIQIYNFYRCFDVQTVLDKDQQIQLCAGDYETGNKDGCQGDSGNGLYVYDKKLTVVAGLVSYGEDCGLAFKPGIYTRISAYLKWIYKKSDF